MTDVNSDDLLKGLLEAYSPSQHERPASEYLAGWMKTAGYDRAFVDESGSAVGILGDGPNEIVMLGHIDTVPGYIKVGVMDGKLYGRGSVDAKGPLATFAAAGITAGRQPGWRIIVIGATEEEAASSKGAHHAVTQYHPAFCIIGEPSQWDRITLGYKGRMIAEYKNVASIHHTARPEPNALETAVDYWNAIRGAIGEINTGRDKAFDQVMSTLRALHSSDDGFQETVTMTMSFRLPPDLPPDAFKPTLQTHANGATLSYRAEEVAYRADKTTPLVRMFNNAIRDAGGKPGFVYKTGTSDMNIVGPVWKCPIVAYGPGDSTLDHTPEEHIVLDEYHKGVEVVANVLRSLPSA